MIDKFSDKHRIVFICLVLALVTLAAFWQVKNNNITNYDDDEYITENPHVKAGVTFKSVTWAFKNFTQVTGIL